MRFHRGLAAETPTTNFLTLKNGTGTELQAPVSRRALGFRKATGAATDGSQSGLWDPTLVRVGIGGTEGGSRDFYVWASAVGLGAAPGEQVCGGTRCFGQKVETPGFNMCALWGRLQGEFLGPLVSKVQEWLGYHSARLCAGLMNRDLWFLSVSPGGVGSGLPVGAVEPGGKASLCRGERLGGRKL